MEQRISYTENRFGFGTKKNLLLLKEMVNYSACLCCNDIPWKVARTKKTNKHTTFTIWAH